MPEKLTMTKEFWKYFKETFNLDTSLEVIGRSRASKSPGI
jgi:hypothetical protein